MDKYGTGGKMFITVYIFLCTCDHSSSVWAATIHKMCGIPFIAFVYLVFPRARIMVNFKENGIRL